jgi:hypothetical protein
LGWIYSEKNISANGARGEEHMSDDYRRNPNFDSTKIRVTNVLREAGYDNKIAFVDEVYKDVRENGGSRFLDNEVIKSSARKLQVPQDDDLWREVFVSNPDIDTPASRSAVRAYAHKHYVPFEVANLRKVLQILIEENPELLLLTPEATERQRRLETRTREINELTNSYTPGFKIRTPNGGIKVYDRDGIEIQFSSAGGRGVKGGGFDEMTDDQVHSIYEQVTEQRRLQSLSKEELRREINPQRQKAFEASSASLGSNPAGIDLIDPNTGAVISDKRTLIRVINSSTDATKRMLTRNGTTDRTLARRFEEILNS